MNRTELNNRPRANRDECIFLPGHPEADSEGFINIYNTNLLNEMAEHILEEKKNFHDMELKNKRKIRILKF
jgi:flagellar basal body rod protein FlgC